MPAKKMSVITTQIVTARVAMISAVITKMTTSTVANAQNNGVINSEIIVKKSS